MIRSLRAGMPVVATMLFPVAALVIVLSRPIHEVDGVERYDKVGGPLAPFRPGMVVEQHMVAAHDQLSAVGLVFTTTDGRSDVRVEFQLLDEAGRVLRERRLWSRELNDFHYSDIWFEPIPDSAGQGFEIRVRGLDARGRRPLQLVTGEHPADPQPLRVDGSLVPGSLLVRTFYGEPAQAVTALPLLLDRASAFKPPWLTLPWSILWIAGALLSVGAFALVVGWLLRGEGDGDV